MSRAERAAAALNDLLPLFSAEDQPGLLEVAMDYFISPSVTFQDQEDSDTDSGDDSESLYNFSIGNNKTISSDNVRVEK